MVSCAWSPIIRGFSFFLLIVSATHWGSLPAEANQVGVCQMAYGSDPSSIPDWLLPVADVTELYTANRYDILATHLLFSGLVDGSCCPGNGLNPDGSANACGLEHSLDQVVAWQNQFDPDILSASQSNEVPPKVIKAVIAVESQFWSGTNWTLGEIGLGQMTGYGADLVLMWRPTYFQSICRQVYGEKGCAKPYQFLEPSTQSLLRGMVLREIDATCPNCPGGVDIEKGKQAVWLLAETLNASCQQSTRIIYITTGKSPASLLSYEDYWRLVLANYHSGAGCVYQALMKTKNPNSWGAIASNLSSGCASGAEYIRRIEEQIKP